MNLYIYYIISYKFIYILYNNLYIYNFFYICIKILNGILAFCQNLEEIFIYFNFDSTNFYLSRFDSISRFNLNLGGFF